MPLPDLYLAIKPDHLISSPDLLSECIQHELSQIQLSAVCLASMDHSAKTSARVIKHRKISVHLLLCRAYKHQLSCSAAFQQLSAALGRRPGCRKPKVGAR